MEINYCIMRKIFYSIKERIVTTHTFDIGVLVLFSIVTVVFLISFINLYI